MSADAPSGGPPRAAIAGLLLLSFLSTAALIGLHRIGQPASAGSDANSGAGTHAHHPEVAGHGSTAPRPRRPLLGDFPDFSLTSHRAKTVDNKSIEGHPTVLHFFFACCDKSCPMMVQQIAELQNKQTHAKARFLSITVDPERDDPEALDRHAQRFAERVGVENIERWHLLTGKKRAIVTLLDACRLPVPPDWTVEGPLGHVDKFLLIDAEGRLRGIYQYDDPEQMAELDEDLELLLGK